MKFARVGVVIAAAAIVVSACGGAAPGGKNLKIGITFPLTGSSLASAGPARDGALLAIKEANAASTVPGYTLEASILDHSVNGQYDAQQGAKDMTTFASDSSVAAVIGPFNSAVAKVQIPINNEAGLLQCSPANTNPDLTKGDAGAQLRAANPDKPTYVRVATTDDIQDQSGTVQGSFINIAGPAAENSYSSVAAIHDIPDAAAFAEKYEAEYG